MNFNITDKAKKQARKTRILNENKWLIFRIVKWLCLICSVISFIIGIYCVPTNEYGLLELFGIIFATTLVVGIAANAIMINISSHWIQDRLNERLWMDSNCLYQFQQVSVAAGLNYRNTDSTGTKTVYKLDSIKNAVYDSKSKRIEFTADGVIYDYSDVSRQIVENEWPLNGEKAYFYDYYEPKLVDVLMERGVKFEYKTIDNYSILDNRI